MCEGKLPRHVDQVALFRVTLNAQVPVILFLWWMWPVLVAFGLQAYNTNCQSSLQLTRVSSHDRISWLQFSWSYAALTEWNVPLGGLRNKSNSSETWCELIVNLRVLILKCRESQDTWQIGKSTQASGYQATGKLRRKHCHWARPWYLSSFVSVWIRCWLFLSACSCFNILPSLVITVTFNYF